MLLEHVHSFASSSSHRDNKRAQLFRETKRIKATACDGINEKDSFHRAVGPGENFHTLFKMK